MNTDVHRFLGKYRGTVFNNLDPENRGRIQAIVPDVQGLIPTTFALPCLPAAGKGSGAYFVPELGAGVWIEFEQGNPDYPIWTGCFWGSTAELPEMGIASPPPTPNMVFQTTGRNSITVFGTPGGGITLCAGPLASPTSPRIMVTQAGIVLTNGQAEIILAGSTVTINKGALMVT
ncbi:phage baseplate assembly protein V [Hymenobacter bucti]|uniref:Phage baseplate assembly protein V n=1 Tax=Hymenobacter bucti TaxID=1844114 RepID=A0ABW4R314_9BACT